MMKLDEEIFCKNIGVYDGQLTKRKSYIVQGINAENVRIKNDQGKLKWYSQNYFTCEKEAEIIFINIDDDINHSVLNIIEVTIQYSDGNRYWTGFTTPEHLKRLLAHQKYIATKLIIVKELTEKQIHQIISELDEQDELIENCRKY